MFTDTPLEGNQAAVFHDGSGLDGATMQRAARELNLSETVFVLPAQNGGDARVRIFTPSAELPFAGHPVLGTAFVLGERTDAPVVRLETGAGITPVELRRDGREVVFGEMDQPLPVREPFEREAELLRALGVGARSCRSRRIATARCRYTWRSTASRRWRGCAPTWRRSRTSARASGVSCFARGGERRFKTRMFAPALGVPEDPATGSAAGPLALHLASHGWIGYGEQIEIRQGEEIRRALAAARARRAIAIIG